MRSWILTWVVALVAAACSPSSGDLDAAVDAGCSEPPPPCCSGGCNGDVMVPALCTPGHKWVCPPDTVSPEDCADAGVRWCIGAPVNPG
jgi:hypothetical protein